MNDLLNTIKLPSFLEQLKSNICEEYNNLSIKDNKELGIESHKLKRWTENIQKFIYGSLIPSCLDDHKNNMSSINNIIKNSIGIELNNNIFNRIKLTDLKEIISYKFFELHKLTIQEKDEKVILNPVSLNLSENLESTTFSSKLDEIKIFFGDNSLIKYLIETIDKKLISIQEENLFHFGSVQKNKKNIEQINEDFYSNLNLFKQENNNNFSNTVNQNNKQLEETLNLLKKYLIERLKINKRLLPNNFNNVIKNSNHRNLIM